MIARPFHTAVASTSAAVMVRPSERAHRASVSAPTGRLFMTFVVFLLGVSWVAADEYTNTRWPTLLLKHLRYAHTINGDTPPPFTTSFLSPNDYLHAMTLPERPISEDTWAAMQLPTLFEGDIEGIEPDSFLHFDAVDDIFSQPVCAQTVACAHAAYLQYYSAINLVTYPDKLWPDARVPYMLEDTLNTEQRAAIAQAFDEYKNKTCIRFVPKDDNDFDYIYVKANKNYGCSSFVGRAGGNQTVSLEVDKCFTKGIIAHELMHALGFFHEHSRSDRDANVDIIEENIKPGMLRNFEKYPTKIIDSLGMPYDFDSVMHYHKLAFSRNGKPTILPRNSNAEIGQRYRLSTIDAQKVRKLYKCTDDTSTVDVLTTTDEPQPTTTEGTRPTQRPVRLTTTAASVIDKCEDLNSHCEMWADIGHCKWSDKYMSHYCRVSCQLCEPSTTSSTLTTNSTPRTTSAPTPVVGGKCVDRNLFCGYWARIGECTSESKFMKVFCRRSCGVCDAVKGVDDVFNDHD